MSNHQPTTVNSLSGGMTSSFIAVHYPADVELFAMVCANDHNINASARARGILDESMMRYANDKLERFSPIYGEFKGTPEDPVIIRTMRDLEQKIGREIVWVRGMSWEDMIALRAAIPNQFKRFCTTITKLYPVFEHCYMHTDLPVKMRIGYRYDELERKDTFTDTIDYPFSCDWKNRDVVRNNLMTLESYRVPNWTHSWTYDIAWRIGEFPLIDNGIFQYHVKEYWKDSSDVIFAEDSNCQHCFWKQEQQLRKNWDSNHSIMAWAGIQEDMIGHTYKKDYNMFQIRNLGIQQEFAFGGGSGCQGGFCTD